MSTYLPFPSPLNAIADVPKRTKRPKRENEPEGPIQEDSSKDSLGADSASRSSPRRARIDKKEWPPYLRDTLIENAKKVCVSVVGVCA